MTNEEIERVERWVQGAIDERIPGTSEVMSLHEAQAKGPTCGPPHSSIDRWPIL
jgi:alanyl-tRNA synthetase